MKYKNDADLVFQSGVTEAVSLCRCGCSLRPLQVMSVTTAFRTVTWQQQASNGCECGAARASSSSSQPPAEPPQRQRGEPTEPPGVFTEPRKRATWRTPVKTGPRFILFVLPRRLAVFTRLRWGGAAEEKEKEKRSPHRLRAEPGGGRSGWGGSCYRRRAVFFGTSRMADREASPIPLEIRARLAELELELSEGKELIRKWGERKRAQTSSFLLPPSLPPLHPHHLISSPSSPVVH